MPAISPQRVERFFADESGKPLDKGGFGGIMPATAIHVIFLDR